MLSDYKIEETEINRYTLDFFGSNMYVLIKGDSALIIDPHVNREVENTFRQKGIKEVWIILTHEHFDHISGVNFFRENWKCTVICGERAKESLPNPKKNLAAFLKAFLLEKNPVIVKAAENILDEEYGCHADIDFAGEYQFEWKGIIFRLVETPGHSEGSICILADGKYLFSGDSLVGDNALITRLPGGSKKEYYSVTKPFLTRLPWNVIVFPGHGEENPILDFNIT